VANLISFFQRNAALALKLAYVGTLGLFIWICAQFYLPGKGFTYLIMFGEKPAAPYVPALKAMNYYEEPGSKGYDAQYYAQIAMRPWLTNRALNEAMDSMPYRARRILFSWTAYGLGGGDPARALHIYAVQNIVCWFLLAGVLLRWFPATSWENFFRWGGVLFSFGLCFSVRGSLVDGPSLLMIAVGMMLYERGRTWWAAGVLGVAGLGKETNLLAAAALLPGRWRDGRGWARSVGQGLLVLAPLALWVVTLRLWLGSGSDPGVRNFDWPFAAYLRKWVETAAVLKTDDAGSIGVWSVLMLVAVTAQWLLFALRPRWSDAWWRLGASYAALLVVLGDAVWEGYPGAALRVLLPMTLAFNVLLPRGRRWRAWLVLGNLAVLCSSDILKPPGQESFQLQGARALRIVEATGRTVEAIFPEEQWFQAERSRFDYWRWTRGDADVVFRNPQAFPVKADIVFDVKSADDRKLTVLSKVDGAVLWSGATIKVLREVRIRGVVLPPGDILWRFESDLPPDQPNIGDPRKVSFSVRNLEILITGRGGMEKAGAAK